MPLLLVDMDDTLVDRTATAHRWASRHVPRWLQPVAVPLLTWLIRRFQAHRLVSRLAAMYERSDPRSYVLEPGVREALEEVRRAGWLIAVITNGNRRTQPAKLVAAGIEPLVDACVISSHEGFAKPDPRVFRLAARRAGTSLEGAWVIGDDLRQEIAGAAKLGLRSIWLNPHGRSPSADVDLEARTFPEAVAIVLAAAPSTGSCG
ncbi:MAG TPA: HAD family hydrolase [Nocardioidaceae bacterium]|nr:HAD family hydrolase [Nocardioidaceae bacterium]